MQRFGNHWRSLFPADDIVKDYLQKKIKSRCPFVVLANSEFALRQKVILCIILLLIVNLAFAQTRQKSPVSSSDEGENTFLRGTIRNYRLQPLYLFKCHTDTLLLVDSTMTNNQGKFSFSKARARVEVVNSGGLYKIALKGDQFFEILYDPAQENAALENGIEIR